MHAFAERNRDVTVTVLRFVNGLGPDIDTSHTALLSLPAVPSILGFDPRYQFIAEDDIAGVLEHAARHELPGVYVDGCSEGQVRAGCVDRRAGQSAQPPERAA